MHLSPRDLDKLVLHGAGFLAQKRLARGLHLNYPETLALLATQLLELIREGKHSVAELMDIGRRMLGRRQVLPGVAELVHDVQVEGTFADGTKLVTVHDPVTLEDGDLALALHGSFLPVPDRAVFGAALPTTPNDAPGYVDVAAGEIHLYEGRARTIAVVTSRGDRPIQVGSHYPFAAVNSALELDRAAAAGKHLDIPAGTAIRFEPGESRTVTLVENATGGGERRLVSPATIARTFDRASGLLPEYDDGDTI